MGTSPRVVRLIPGRVGSISSLYEAKPNLKAKSLFATLKRKSHITNGSRPNIFDEKKKETKTEVRPWDGHVEHACNNSGSISEQCRGRLDVCAENM